MLHLSHVKQMYSQTMHLIHELKLCIQITRRRVDFNGDSTVNDPCWCRDSNHDLPNQVLCFAASPSSQDLVHFGPHSSGQYSGGPLWSGRQPAVWNPVQTCPTPLRLERVLPPICLAYLLPQQSPALVFVNSTRSYQVGHPSKYCPGPMLLNFSVQLDSLK